MSLSIGALALISPSSPRTTAFRSFICALVVLAVVLILAYLTNPTEISFRAYLTEQSFRQHLSHLDDLSDESRPEPDCSDRPSSVDRAALPFHFANRASISLRTPKHIFHSFGLCTLAATQGAAVPPGASNASSDLDAFVSSDSWFIGAFGRWWRGGLVHPWYYHAIIRSKDTQGWSSGILGFKPLDKFNDYNALPFTKLAPCPRSLLRGSPPRLRNRERSAQRSGPAPNRDSSPPPLPKSVSLPLHADHRLHDFLPAAPQASHITTDQKRIAVHAPPAAHPISRTPSVSGTSDSPTIADILKQITATQASVHDLQNQLQDAQNATNQSHDSLEAELTDLRSRRREEDQKRLDGRARTKTLEEGRRMAETTKRDAEKKMKAARNAKDAAVRRLEELELEIHGLKGRMDHDRAVLAEPTDADMAEEEELVSELERKKKEVRVAEEVVVALNTRARELEEKIDESKSRLRAVQHRARLAKTYPLPRWDPTIVDQFKYGNTDSTTWSSSYNPFDVPADDVLTSSIGSGDTGPESRDILGFSSAPRAQGYGVFNDDISCVDAMGYGHNSYFQTKRAAPFPLRDPPTPSAAFIPSSLISVLDSPSADWKGGFGPLTASPSEYTAPTLKAESDSSHDQPSMCHETAIYETHGSDDMQEVARKCRETTSGCFSKNGKRRSGLNPDAKVFRLTRFTSDKGGSADTSTTSVSPYDALNPTGLASNVTSSTPSSLLRAFAPSRAEREALRRALGGSTNTSLERLPSLTDVGSIPPSPVHAHGEAQGKSIGEKNCVLPAWLQSLPLIQKPNFSPWEDEDEVSTEVKSK